MKNYLPFWLIIFASFAIIFVLSAFDDVSLGSYQPKSSGFYETLLGDHQSVEEILQTGTLALENVVAETQQVEVDTAAKTILFIGDSMLDGLSPRLAAYADHNGHKLYSVIWYSSTSERWAKSGKLAHYINRLHPDYIFICLGSNELTVRDIVIKRDIHVKKIIEEIGEIPYLWIGPPNWKPDTGINRLIASNSQLGSYFKSDGMTFERSKDGAHPTKQSASEWMDSIARWMPKHSSHPIRLDLPNELYSKPARVFVHQPDER